MFLPIFDMQKFGVGIPDGQVWQVWSRSKYPKYGEYHFLETDVATHHCWCINAQFDIAVHGWELELLAWAVRKENVRTITIPYVPMLVILLLSKDEELDIETLSK